jgi:hypothetical protein
MKSDHSRSRLAAILVIAVGFFISRILFAREGIPFYDGALMLQTLDLGLLRTHLAQSIFYLHSQPPLLNLFLGLVLKLTANSFQEQQVLQNCFLVMGFSLMLITFQLMLDFEVPIAIALLLVLLFEVNPGTLMLEGWYYSAYPTQILLCGSAFSLRRFLNHGDDRYGVAFLTCAGLPIFLNSSFQPIWFVAVLGFCYYAFGRRIRTMGAPIAVVIGLIAILLIKNALVFGLVTTSSWFGMNLARMTTFQISQNDRQEEIRAGGLSEFASITPFSGLNHYPMETAKPTGIPVLDLPRKSNGQFNLNNIAYIDISRHYLSDAVRTLKGHPGVYFHSILEATRCYFGTVKDLYPHVSNLLGAWNTSYNVILQPSEAWWWPRAVRCDTVSLTLLVGLPSIFCLTFFRLARADAWSPGDFTKAFMLLAIAYASVLGVMLEVGENSRFRSVVDPLYLVLLGSLLGDLVHVLSGFRNRSGPISSPFSDRNQSPSRSRATN